MTITTARSHRITCFAGALLLLSLGACSSDNKKNKPAPQETPATVAPETVTSGTVAPVWTEGEYRPYTEFANLCEQPKAGNHPATGKPYGHRQGTAMHEKMWLRSLSNQFYLWYDQLPDIDPQPLTTLNYFDRLKTPEDRFHFVKTAEDFYSSAQSGVFLDNGVRWVTSAADSEELRVADLASGYMLETQLKRGDTLIAVDGAYLSGHDRQEAAIISAGLHPTAADPVHVFTLEDVDTGAVKDVMLTARALEHNPVPRHSTLSHNDSTFGYLQFDNHNAIAEPRLINAVTELRDANIDELILDLRYNDGGYMYIASQLSYMIAGAGSTDGMAFVYPRFNDKYTEISPIDGKPITGLEFLTSGAAEAGAPPTALPTLDLDRVYVLTSRFTCSASEAIINGLKGVGVEVVQIGEPTCGKPYVFIPVENCGMVYHTVFHSSENAMGFGDYLDGFRPTNGSAMETASVLPGCAAADDLNHALGSPEETLVAAALQWHDTQTCPAASAASFTAQALGTGGSQWFEGSQHLWTRNALMVPPRD